MEQNQSNLELEYRYQEQKELNIALLKIIQNRNAIIDGLRNKINQHEKEQLQMIATTMSEMKKKSSGNKVHSQKKPTKIKSYKNDSTANTSYS